MSCLPGYSHLFLGKCEQAERVARLFIGVFLNYLAFTRNPQQAKMDTLRTLRTSFGLSVRAPQQWTTFLLNLLSKVTRGCSLWCIQKVPSEGRFSENWGSVRTQLGKWDKLPTQSLSQQKASARETSGIASTQSWIPTSECSGSPGFHPDRNSTPRHLPTHPSPFFTIS